MTIRQRIILRAMECLATGRIFPTHEEMARDFGCLARSVRSGFPRDRNTFAFRGVRGGRRYVSEVRLRGADKRLVDVWEGM